MTEPFLDLQDMLKFVFICYKLIIVLPIANHISGYIPKKTEKENYEWYEHDLMTYIDVLKYKQFVENMDSHFSRAKITNFDMIHHQCQGNQL